MAFLNASIDRPMSSAAQCTPYLIPLNITSLNIIVNLTHFTNDLDLAKTVSDITGKNSQANFHPVGGIENVTAVYTISGTFCSPKTLRVMAARRRCSWLLMEVDTTDNTGTLRTSRTSTVSSRTW
jgi:hypothetical protein